MQKAETVPYKNPDVKDLRPGSSVRSRLSQEYSEVAAEETKTLPEDATRKIDELTKRLGQGEIA